MTFLCMKVVTEKSDWHSFAVQTKEAFQVCRMRLPRLCQLWLLSTRWSLVHRRRCEEPAEQQGHWPELAAEVPAIC